MKILIIQGPNLNMLGFREPYIYGSKSLNDLHESLTLYAEKNNIQIVAKQSNHEGDIINLIHSSESEFDGIVINAGAYTHYSYAIRDAISAITRPVVEVHISNIYKREEFRHHSVIAPVVIGQISGLGFNGYFYAIDYLIKYLRGEV